MNNTIQSEAIVIGINCMCGTLTGSLADLSEDATLKR